MTKQEIYEKVRNHLLAQGRKSTCDDYCLYRSLEGFRCAAGCLILDEYYKSSLEKKIVGDTDVDAALVASGVSSRHLPFVALLQELHDSYSSDVWPHIFEQVDAQRPESDIQRKILNHLSKP